MSLDLSNITILIVEDQRSIRGLLFTTLRALGVGKVVAVPSVEDAMDLLQGNSNSGKLNVQAILLDIILGDTNKNGLDLAEWVRTSTESPNKFIPIMMFSALASMSMVQRSRDLGVNVFMRKPFAVDNLTTLLMGLIRDQRNFVKTISYFGPDRRRSSQKNVEHDPQRRQEYLSNSDKGLKIYKRGKGAGAYVLRQEDLSKAGAVFEEITLKAITDLDERLQKAQVVHKILIDSMQTMQKISTSGQENESELMVNMANDVLDNMVLVRLNLGVFRVPLLSRISEVLSQFVCQLTIKPVELINQDSVVLIEKFINFMQVIIRHMDDLDSAQSDLIIKELLQACSRFSRKYIVDPIDDEIIDVKIRDSIQRLKDQNLLTDRE